MPTPKGLSASLVLSLSLLAILPRAADSAPLIYLDPGHTLEHPGVIGTCGTQEVWVNDQVALKLADVLKISGYQVAFSRTPNTDRSRIVRKAGREDAASLRRRSERANSLGADLFVSLHHDAISEDILVSVPDACPNQSVANPLAISPEFLKNYQVGFNVFIHSSPGAKFRSSLKLANLIGKGFIEANQTPANFHIPEVEEDCTSCHWQNKSLGVMSRNLAVIRKPTMPALLIEITNLRLPDLERMANDPSFQETIAQIIKLGIDQYFSSRAPPRLERN